MGNRTLSILTAGLLVGAAFVTAAPAIPRTIAPPRMCCTGSATARAR
jgi:hypothetical protein